MTTAIRRPQRHTGVLLSEKTHTETNGNNKSFNNNIITTVKLPINAPVFMRLYWPEPPAFISATSSRFMSTFLLVVSVFSFYMYLVSWSNKEMVKVAISIRAADV